MSVHHVCGEHEWVEGECSHGPLVLTEEGKTFLEMDSKSRHTKLYVTLLWIVLGLKHWYFMLNLGK